MAQGSLVPLMVLTVVGCRQTLVPPAHPGEPDEDVPFARCRSCDTANGPAGADVRHRGSDSSERPWQDASQPRRSGDPTLSVIADVLAVIDLDVACSPEPCLSGDIDGDGFDDLPIHCRGSARSFIAWGGARFSGGGEVL